MRDDIQQGRRPVAELKNMLEKNLQEAYGVSRDTARKARRVVLSEFGED
jgi:DNA-binding GntR family transcriptional regulator